MYKKEADHLERRASICGISDDEDENQKDMFD